MNGVSGLCFALVFIYWVTILISSNTDGYTVNRGDRLWVDNLRHAALDYSNRAWFKRKEYEYLREFAIQQRQGRKQYASIYGSNYTVNTNASNIDRGRIFGHNFDILPTPPKPARN
uniref:Cathepsin propeptide inhibitor domain-containing protein n=1 Tax=Panagrellus redivivus TaxID=6233 RepID=A0A7E4W855_PANRE